MPAPETKGDKSPLLGRLAAVAIIMALTAYTTRALTKERFVKVVSITYPSGSYSPHLIALTEPNLEETAPPRQDFIAPFDASNVALGKDVTSEQTSEPIIGELQMLVDGDNEHGPGGYLELDQGLQWIQIDLGAEHRLYAIQLWRHNGHTIRSYSDTVIQISSDPDFHRDVLTVYNNDHDDSARLGRGQDKAYLESSDGRLFKLDGQRARYVRFWSNGNSSNIFNHYIEAQVYGCPSPLPGL